MLFHGILFCEYLKCLFRLIAGSSKVSFALPREVVGVVTRLGMVHSQLVMAYYTCQSCNKVLGPVCHEGGQQCTPDCPICEPLRQVLILWSRLRWPIDFEKLASAAVGLNEMEEMGVGV